MIEAIAGATATCAANLLLHTTIVLALTLGVASILGRRSAGGELVMLRAGLVAAACTPVAGLLAQSYGWSVLMIGMPEPGASLGGATALARPGAAGGEVVTAAYLTFGLFWLAGFAARATMLTLDCRRLARWRHASAEASRALAARVDRLARDLGVATPRVRCSDRIDAPCVFGCLRPVLLVPRSRQGEAAIGDAAISHELSHLRGRDCLWQVVGRMIEAVLFFQPMVPLLLRRMATTCETVSDEQALRVGQDRRAYAQELLRWAESNRAASDPPLAMSVMKLRSQLGRRIARIMRDDHRVAPPPRRIEVAAIATAAAAFSLGANAVFLAHTQAAGLAGIAWIWCAA